MARNIAAQARADVYSRITAEIVAAIEAGAGSWKMPWHHDGSAITRPTNVSGRRYRGVNVIALWVAAQAAGYGTGLWGTYRQYQALGAQVRKGERATTVVFWKQFSACNDADDSDEENGARQRLFARAFSVFNCAQVDGYRPPTTTTVPTAECNAAVDAFVTALKIPITYGAFDAHYRIDLDHIFMPPFEAFDDAASFVGTEIHECAHATGAKHRLNRDFGARFANEARSIEEITAELTAGFILADLGIAHHPRADHASYIASWLTLLKDSPRAIFAAASQAQAAADWMHAQQPNSSNAADEVPSGNCFKIMRRDDSSVADSVAPRFSGKGRERQRTQGSA
jgi:antirestriction protein ArdC